MQNLKLIIFDLDGTLLDTLSDLAHSTNYALNKNGFPIHPIESYKKFVGNGINKLFERALPDTEKTTENILRIKKDFIPYYDRHNTDYTRPYKGIPDLLNTILAQNIMLAVASNKYQSATEKLVNAYFPDIPFSAILGQREGIPVKPDPAIVHEILKTPKSTTKETLYIGDSGIDMQTALNSNITSIGVTWGFRPREELQRYGANYIADSATDILNAINNKEYFLTLHP